MLRHAREGKASSGAKPSRPGLLDCLLPAHWSVIASGEDPNSESCIGDLRAAEVRAKSRPAGPSATGKQSRRHVVSTRKESKLTGSRHLAK